MDYSQESISGCQVTGFFRRKSCHEKKHKSGHHKKCRTFLYHSKHKGFSHGITHALHIDLTEFRGIYLTDKNIAKPYKSDVSLQAIYSSFLVPCWIFKARSASGGSNPSLTGENVEPACRHAGKEQGTMNVEVIVQHLSFRPCSTYRTIATTVAIFFFKKSA